LAKVGVSQPGSHRGQQRRRALVAVLLDASSTPHYIDNGREPYERAAEDIPWTTFEFFDQHTFSLFKEAVEQREVDAFLIASGSLDGGEMRRLVREESFVAASHEAIRTGTGAVVLHQHPPSSGTLDYGFLPDTLAVEISCAHTDEHYLPADNIEGVGVLDVLGPAGDGGGDRLQGTTKVTGAQLADALCRGQRGKDAWHRDRLLVDSLSWDVVAKEREDGDLLLLRSRLPGVSVVVSAVPLDWNRSTLLPSLVALALRERGCLYLRSTPSPAEVDDAALDESDAATVEPHVQRLEEDGLFVAEQRVPLDVLKQADCDLHTCSLGAFFGTLAFSTAWHLPDLPWLTSDDILGRLECKGSLVVSCSAATGRDMLVEIARPPMYAQHAEEFAEWLAAKLVRPEQLSPFELRAAVAAVATIEAAFRDRTAVPRAAARDHVAKLLAPELVERTREGNVDTDPLRTAAVLAVASFLGGDDLAAVARNLASWLSVEENFRGAGSYELVQALVWNDALWDAPLGTWLRKRRAAWEADVAELPYALILASRHGAAGSQGLVNALARVAGDETTPVAARGEAYLELARLGESGIDDGEKLLQLQKELIRAKRWLRQQIAVLAPRPGAVEAVSVLTAALINIAKREAVGVTGRESGHRRYRLETDELAVAAGRAEERRAELQRAVERARELESERDWLRVMVGFLALLTAGLGAAMAAVFVGYAALLGTLTGMIGLYVTLATWGPRLAPQLAALPGGRKPPTAR
jgi:hypothetical protein